MCFVDAFFVPPMNTMPDILPVSGTSRVQCPMYRMLACDIDHTLLPYKGHVSDQDKKSLQELHRSGVTVVLATGRATASTQLIMDRIFTDEPPDYAICYNGSQVLDVKRNENLVYRTLDPATIAELSAWCRENGAWLQGYEEGGFVVEQDTSYVRAYAESSGMRYTVVDNLSEYVTPHGGSPKLVCHDVQERLVHHDTVLREISNGRWTVVTSMPIFLELLPPDTNKGTAIHTLAEHLGYRLEEVIAVGDNLNDIEMIQRVGMGIAVANAVPELKEVAGAVTERDEHNSAVTEVIQRYFAR